MSLRVKIVVALIALSTLAAVTIGWVGYRSTEAQSRATLDANLDVAADQLESTVRGRGRGPGRGDPFAGRGADSSGESQGGAVRQRLLRAPDDVVWQVVVGDSVISSDATAQELPVPSELDEGEVWQDVEVDGEPFRTLTWRVSDDSTIQVARSLAGTDEVLAALRGEIALASLGVAAVAGLLGWLIARQATQPLTRLTRTAEHVAETGDLDTTVPVEGDTEAGRLAVSFNEMLAALRRSKEQQQRLVQDAGHELRTPLTSLRTNVYLLDRWDRMDESQRERILTDLRVETEELTVLIDEIVGVATDRAPSEPVVEVALGELAATVAARVAARTGREVHVDADTTVVSGRAGLLERAITNVVENACKFDTSGEAVELWVRDGTVWVRDHGPGVAAVDRPMIFERFYRSDAARSAPGSGLGLSIVAEVARLHDGTVFVEDPADGAGGAVIGFRVPVVGSTGA